MGEIELFGYVKVNQANLLGKEYDTYKSIYCGLCKQLGKDYSVFARFILSYDCTFYAMLILSLADKDPTFYAARCRFNPLKKCAYAKTESKAMSLAAALSVSSAYYKLRDNLLDSPWYKRIGYRMIQPFFASWKRKCVKKHPRMVEILKEMSENQIKHENDPACHLDMAADPTATMLSKVCGLIPDEVKLRTKVDPEKVKRILSTFGYFFGRWIYLIDAADDYDDDMRHGSFNAFALADKPDDMAGYLRSTLNHCLSEALLSYSLLDKGVFDSIIQNVLKDSCVNIQTQIINRYQNSEGA